MKRYFFISAIFVMTLFFTGCFGEYDYDYANQAYNEAKEILAILDDGDTNAISKAISYFTPKMNTQTTKDNLSSMIDEFKDKSIVTCYLTLGSSSGGTIDFGRRKHNASSWFNIKTDDGHLYTVFYSKCYVNEIDNEGTGFYEFIIEDQNVSAYLFFKDETTSNEHPVQFISSKEDYKPEKNGFESVRLIDNWLIYYKEPTKTITEEECKANLVKDITLTEVVNVLGTDFCSAASNYKYWKLTNPTKDGYTYLVIAFYNDKVNYAFFCNETKSGDFFLN